MKLIIVLGVLAAVCCATTFARPEYLELEGLEQLENAEPSTNVEVGELVRHKRLSCWFENEDIKATACAMSCIYRKGRKGGRCENGICRCTPN